MSDGPPEKSEEVAPHGRLLRREDFTPERVRRITDEVAKRGNFALMSEEARNASLKAARASIPEGEDVWVFGYGSLMWNPAICVADSRKARIRGYHRAFCLTMNIGRGTAENPGLMLGIDRGGSCTGVAHRIAVDEIESELTILWYREMLSGAYEPRWLNAEIEGQEPARVLTFAVNRAHPRYEAAVEETEAARRIAAAEGIRGTNRDYLYRTAAHLREMGIVDGPIHRLERRVREAAGEPHTEGA